MAKRVKENIGLRCFMALYSNPPASLSSVTRIAGMALDLQHTAEFTNMLANTKNLQTQEEQLERMHQRHL